MKNKICYGKAKNIWINRPYKVKSLSWSEIDGNHHAYSGVKRIKMKCELCGRRVWSSIFNTEDGDLVHVLPPHKIKYWWKRKGRHMWK